MSQSFSHKVNYISNKNWRIERPHPLTVLCNGPQSILTSFAVLMIVRVIYSLHSMLLLQRMQFFWTTPLTCWEVRFACFCNWHRSPVTTSGNCESNDVSTPWEWWWHYSKFHASLLIIRPRFCYMSMERAAMTGRFHCGISRVISNKGYRAVSKQSL